MINANAVATVGMTACHQGQTTGHTCGKVQSITYRPIYAGACAPFATCNATFVSVIAPRAGGDSGGPWHVGSADLGIHKGGTGSNIAIYSKLGYAPSYSAP